MFVKSNIPDNRVALWLPAFPDKPDTEVFIYGDESFEVPDDDGDVLKAIAERKIIKVDAPAAKPRKNKPQEPNGNTPPPNPNRGTQNPDPNAPPVTP